MVIGRVDARAGGILMTSGSGGASGMGASSSSSQASTMAHSTRSSGAGSGSLIVAVVAGTQATPTSRPRLVFIAGGGMRLRRCS